MFRSEFAAGALKYSRIRKFSDYSEILENVIRDLDTIIRGYIEEAAVSDLLRIILVFSFISIRGSTRRRTSCIQSTS